MDKKQMVICKKWQYLDNDDWIMSELFFFFKSFINILL